MPLSDADARLFRAVRKAVEVGLLPKAAPCDQYLANIEKIRAVLAAADEETASPMAVMVAEYSNAVGRYGPDSKQAATVRWKYNSSHDLCDLFDTIDRIKRSLGGSGIDWPADEKP